MDMTTPTTPTEATPPGTPSGGRKRGRGADPERTRRELVDAAFEALRQDGIAGTTARSIAARAGCNQAAIYYHFGGIEPLLIQALQESSVRRLDRYREELGDSTDIEELLRTIEALYADDRESGHMAVLTELAGGIASSPQLREGIDLATRPWLDFVEERIRMATSDLPFAALLPAEDLADLIFSVVVGLELRSRVDGREDRPERLFRLASVGAALVGRSMPPSG
ncbi:TetR/AcrR family transcriptional regulator [Ilumatobacter nonamiensis]|uniref:TetR/AcrR family transcriptional regulator n=1 Tax=Ilumatobacter nonamiensis TaxID=467093 RepID=UPI000348A425|nr:TetR/AcrR family transcriptional regulator [Ilumatobacter nonamiensis]